LNTVDQIFGLAGNDTLIGNDGDDLLVGGAGDDVIQAGAGNDEIRVGAGDGFDAVDGGAGTDVILATGAGTVIGLSSLASVETISANNFANVLISGSAAGDTLNFGGVSLVGINRVEGGAGDDIIGGFANAITLVGGAGNDILTGSGGNDLFLFTGAGDGADAITGGAGADTVQATVANTVIGLSSFAGIETISSGGFSGVSIAGSTNADALNFTGITLNGITRIDGGAGDDAISGVTPAMTYSGGAGDDSITGGGANDIFEFAGAGDGFDAIAGGAGTDTIRATASNTVIGLTGITAVETITANGFAGVTISGSANADTLNFTGATLTGITRIDGGAGNDTISGVTAAMTYAGGAGDDTITGGSGADFFQFTGTGDGFDSINGGTGTDTIRAMAANTVIGLSGITAVEAITANGFTGVTISGSGNADTLNFSGATLTNITRIDGGAGNDTISGVSVAMTYAGGAGDDTITGGAGADFFQFSGTGDGFDAITGGNGTDTIRAMAAGTVIGLRSITTVEAITANGFANVSISGSSGADTLNFNGVTLTNITRIDGGAGNDSITGSSGNDVISGGAGNDTLSGGTGTDTVDYSYGTVAQAINLSLATAQTISAGDVDTLSAFENATGGSGNDTIIGTTGNNVLDGGAGNDRITGGIGNDTIIGGTGTDTLVLAGDQSTYTISTVNGVVTITDNQKNKDGNDGTDTLVGIEFVEFKGGTTMGVTSPIILDLDGQGVQTLSASDSHARYDMDGDGLADDTSWFGRTEGMLVLDRNGDGKVTNAGEFSFIGDVAGAHSDLEGLRAWDSNQDGVLSNLDVRFNDFRIWQDKDGDGVAEDGEVMTLTTAGVKSINLTGTAVTGNTEAGDVVVVNKGSYTRTNGSTMEFIDAALTYFSAQDALPTVDDIAQTQAHKAKKYMITFAGGEMFLGLTKAAEDLDPRAGQLGLVSSMHFKDKTAGVFSPIILDLDGDGVDMRKLKKGHTYFDVDGDGTKERVGWASGGDGFLVIDRNGDGQITDGSELLFGAEDADARNALEALGALDNNNDNVIDSKDARFGELKVWVDANANGVTDEGELKSLADLGIKSIGLSAHHLEGQVKVGANALISTAVFTRTDGTTGTVGDTALAFRSIPADAIQALSVLRTPLLEPTMGWNSERLEELVAQFPHTLEGLLVPEDVAQHTGQFGNPIPVDAASPSGEQDRLLALMTQDMATFGATPGAESQLNSRDREVTKPFDFFA
jgi:Ca2+-binding RTX toxin-like protein